jgi:DNA-binding NtrC family response regulator
LQEWREKRLIPLFLAIHGWHDYCILICMKTQEPETNRKPILRILIVDDDQNSLKAVSFCLSPLGYECTQANQPQIALQQYRAQPYDIVITDMQMPGMSGIELLKAIRAIDEKAKVVILTGHGDLKTAAAAINNRAYGFLGKPLVITELYDIVHSIEREIYQEKSEIVDKRKLEEAVVGLRDVYRELLRTLKTMGMPGGKNE